MPVVQGTGQFNLGRDCTVILTGPRGEVQISNVTGFDLAAETTQVKVRPLDGRNMHAALPEGYSGTIEFERADSKVDDEFSAAQADWKNAGNVTVYTLLQIIREADGSISRFQLDNVAATLQDTGRWQADASVKGRISLMGDNRRRV